MLGEAMRVDMSHLPEDMTGVRPRRKRMGLKSTIRQAHGG
jgi:hypothetical protein